MNTNRIMASETEPAETNRIINGSHQTQTRTNIPTSRQRPPARKRFLAILACSILALGLAYAGWRWWNYSRTWVVTDNAYVAGHIHTVSSRIAGTVTEVLVGENQEVAAGTVLARLDANDLQVQREKALAAIAQAEAKVAEARAQVERDHALVSKAQLDYERADKLFHDAIGAIAKQEFDTARAALDAAQASLSAARATVLGAEAQVKVAAAQLKEVELQLSYTEIAAPAAGRIGRKNIEAGNRVQPGQALLAIVQPDVWVTANFKETQLNRLRPGQAVDLRVDSFPGHTFAGRLESFSAASGAQFALLPPDNATGNFTKIVQRVPVKMVFDEKSFRDFPGGIIPGMSVVAKVNVRR